mmetsp:Transcript_1225/g.2985  ORF Transcript_1225/g.2985 Transcript_1225/m.2985 type:complete len:524 (+) Transcript_1225:63-1634(+)
MAGVDFCRAVPTPTAVPAAPVGPGGDFSCTACAESFPASDGLRVHCKSERHLYNTKRRLAGLKPISQEAWERKLREARSAEEQRKGTAHLKKGKEPRKHHGKEAREDAPESGDGEAPVVEEEPLTPRRSLFDQKRFGTVEECLTHMQKTYGFFIPDQEYCTDVPGLLGFLGQKLSQPPHACIYCNRRFPDLRSVRRHMADKSHMRVVTEFGGARTRRGNLDEYGTEELQAELEEFYDFHASTREVTERIKDPAQKAAAMLRYFDRNGDGRLCREELAKLWEAVSEGAELSDTQYVGACRAANADPDEGLDMLAMCRLYAEGVANLDEHWAVLQDLLTQSRKKKPGKEGKEADGEDKAAEEESDGDEDGESESDDGEDSDTEVVECEDEDEFEEVMRVLGLQAVAMMPNGDLRLPNGAVATHRDVSYIYRQRGKRPDQVALMGSAAGPKRGHFSRSQLMLSNSAAGCSRIAMTKREEARNGKRIIAVLRSKQHYDMKLGMAQNILQKKAGLACRTGRGDASGGR